MTDEFNTPIYNDDEADVAQMTDKTVAVLG